MQRRVRILTSHQNPADMFNLTLRQAIDGSPGGGVQRITFNRKNRPMNKLILMLFLVFSLLQMAPAVAADPDSTGEETPAWSGGVELAGTNRYVWRGMSVNKGSILQPTTWLTHKDLTLSLWSSWTLNKPTDDIKRNEVDAILSYEFALANVTVEGAFNYYHYIDQPDAPNTGELACTLGYPIGLMTVKAGVSVDVIEYPGATFFQQSIELEKEFNDQWSMRSVVRISEGSKKFNDAYFGYQKNTVSLLSLEGALSYTLSNGIYLSPFVQFNQTLNSDLKAYMEKHTTCFMLTLGKEF